MKKPTPYPTYHCQHLQTTCHTLNALLDIFIEGSWDWNADTGEVTRSPGWYRMLGYEVGIFLKDVFTWENIIHPDDYQKVMMHFESYINGKIDTYQIEYRCKRADGSYLWIIDRGRVVAYHDDGSVARMIGAHENIHDRKMAQNELITKNQLLKKGNLTLEKLLNEKNRELEEKNELLEHKIQEIEHLSITDQLTNLSNRRKFEQELLKEIARAKRYGYALSLVIMDIDYFKKINDGYGHKIGNQVLISLSNAIAEHIRIHDHLARWGGEEFVIILPDTGLDKALSAVENLKQLISKMTFDHNITLTCSFGIAQFKPNENIDDFFIRADKALYQAKTQGRNRVECTQ